MLREAAMDQSGPCSRSNSHHQSFRCAPTSCMGAGTANRLISKDAIMEATVPAPPVEKMARWLKLLGDETRLRILYYLQTEHELNVRSLCDRIGQSQPAVSHHLALLRDHGVIECRRSGKNNSYSLVAHESEDLVARILSQLGRRKGDVA